MYIDRHISSKVKEYSKQFPSLIITGPRQVGKTTLLKHINNDIEYLTFDDPILKQHAKEDSNLFLKTYDFPIILDEVQYVPELFPYIKMRIDTIQENNMYLMTGSQSFELMKNANESLAGRVAILELSGLSLRELYNIDFHSAFIPSIEYFSERKRKLKSYDDLWYWIHRGSMPRLNDKDIDWELYYSSYVKTYIERDLRSLVDISNEITFLNFMTALAARTGEMLNYSQIASDIGISVDTAKRWTSLLKTSGIIYIMQPYYNNVLTRVVKTPKVYFTDTGLVCYLTRWLTPETLRNGAKAGNIFETFIVNEIIKSYKNAGITNVPLYYYRDKDKKEIDVIIEVNGVLHPVEIKMSASPTKSMIKSFNVLDSIPGIKRGLGAVICQYDSLFYLEEEVVVLPINYI